jgi:hypothetical protein
MALTIALIFASGFATFWLFSVYLEKRKKEKKKPTPLYFRNLKKEQDLIERLLLDIKENSNDWFIETMTMGDGNFFINDKRNIGILYRITEHQLVIHLNLQNLDRFNIRDEDTIAIELKGTHISDFIQKAEQYIDRRGKELDFFKDKLKERL